MAVTQGAKDKPLRSQPRIDRLALQREHGEAALMDAPQWLAAHEPLQRFHTERKLAQRQRPLGPQGARAQPVEVLRRRVFRAIDDPQILSTATFHGRLYQSTPPLRHEVEWLHHHPLAALSRELL